MTNALFRREIIGWRRWMIMRMITIAEERAVSGMMCVVGATKKLRCGHFKYCLLSLFAV